jgi:hypothetical protein
VLPKKLIFKIYVIERLCISACRIFTVSGLQSILSGFLSMIRVEFHLLACDCAIFQASFIEDFVYLPLHLLDSLVMY